MNNNLFKIDSEEIKRILSLHEESTKTQYLNVLTEQLSQNNDSYTLAYNINLENTKSNAHELKLFKGTVFRQSGKQGILKSNNIKFQYVNTASGKPDYDGAKSGVVYYKCNTGKFFVPGNNESFYIEPSMNREPIAEGIKKVCNYKQGTFINKNESVIGEKYKVYPNTKFNKVTQGATFSVVTINTNPLTGLGQKFKALFNCKDSKFYINNEALTETNNKKLTSTLFKQYCSSQVKPAGQQPVVQKSVDPKLEKAQKCGHKSWEEYKASKWKCTPTQQLTVDPTQAKLTPVQQDFVNKTSSAINNLQSLLGITPTGKLDTAQIQSLIDKLKAK